jgi:hypothetical protein
MRQTMRLFLGILLLTSVSAFADSFSNLSASLTINPNNGSGGNIGGTITGPGVNLQVGGGASGGFGGTIYWDFAIGGLGSQNYTNMGNGGAFPYLALDPATLNVGGFTFPTNPQDFSTFTVTVPASLGIVTGTIEAQGADCNPCKTFVLTTIPGLETMSFQYDPVMGFQFTGGSFTSSTTTPEPGALGLMATGIGALTWLRARRKAA